VVDEPGRRQEPLPLLIYVVHLVAVVTALHPAHLHPADQQGVLNIEMSLRLHPHGHFPVPASGFLGIQPCNMTYHSLAFINQPDDARPQELRRFMRGSGGGVVVSPGFVHQCLSFLFVSANLQPQVGSHRVLGAARLCCRAGGPRPLTSRGHLP
jgi:hypothetical protein